jgi:hypothetical protein
MGVLGKAVTTILGHGLGSDLVAIGPRSSYPCQIPTVGIECVRNPRGRGDSRPRHLCSLRSLLQYLPPQKWSQPREGRDRRNGGRRYADIFFLSGSWQSRWRQKVA